MKTDRELLELAANAAGIEYHIDTCDGCEKLVANNYGAVWNPLLNDAQALRLAVKLGIIVSFSVDLTAAYAKRWDIVPVNEPTTDEIGQIHNPDLLTATRRAIVLAAAEVGSGRP